MDNDKFVFHKGELVPVSLEEAEKRMTHRYNEVKFDKADDFIEDYLENAEKYIREKDIMGDPFFKKGQKFFIQGIADYIFHESKKKIEQLAEKANADTGGSSEWHIALYLITVEGKIDSEKSKSLLDKRMDGYIKRKKRGDCYQSFEICPLKTVNTILKYAEKNVRDIIEGNK